VLKIESQGLYFNFDYIYCSLFPDEDALIKYQLCFDRENPGDAQRTLMIHQEQNDEVRDLNPYDGVSGRYENKELFF
jgi:hypothetical protein